MFDLTVGIRVITIEKEEILRMILEDQKISREAVDEERIDWGSGAIVLLAAAEADGEVSGKYSVTFSDMVTPEETIVRRGEELLRKQKERRERDAL